MDKTRDIQNLSLRFESQIDEKRDQLLLGQRDLVWAQNAISTFISLGDITVDLKKLFHVYGAGDHVIRGHGIGARPTMLGDVTFDEWRESDPNFFTAPYRIEVYKFFRKLPEDLPTVVVYLDPRTYGVMVHDGMEETARLVNPKLICN